MAIREIVRLVRLDRNLTLKRLPESMQDKPQLRLVVFETDAETGAKSIRDIFDGPFKSVIKHFNCERKWYAESGIECTIEAGSFY